MRRRRASKHAKTRPCHAKAHTVEHFYYLFTRAFCCSLTILFLSSCKITDTAIRSEGKGRFLPEEKEEACKKKWEEREEAAKNIYEQFPSGRPGNKNGARSDNGREGKYK